MERQLQKKLLSLAKQDQKMRLKGKWNVLIDKKNVRELKKIIKRYGWPKISDVGLTGSESAWLIAQHADFDQKFQLHTLRMIKDLAKKKEAPLHQVAYLTDRILVNKKRKQIFGTQFYRDQYGNFILKPIRKRKNLDEKRVGFNLPPLQLYIKKLREMKKGG